MDVIVDTNVLVTANGEAVPQASQECEYTCVYWIEEIQAKHILRLDDGWDILGEYEGQLLPQRGSGFGYAFLRWVLRNRANPAQCRLVRITPQESDGRMSFAEFPADPALDGFDPSDRKFVAVARAHPTQAPILNAVDTDWWHYRKSLEAHGIQIEFLCPDAMHGHSG